MKVETRYEIEAQGAESWHNDVDLSATYEGGVFHFTAGDGGDVIEFKVKRSELVALLKETEPTDYASQAVNIQPISTEQAENWLRAHKGKVVEIKVRRKSGCYEMRYFEVYSIKDGTVNAWQQNHNHFEKFSLSDIAELWATGQGFEPRYDIEL